MKVDNYFDIEQAIPNPKRSLYEASPDRNKFLSNFNTRWCEPLTACFLSEMLKHVRREFSQNYHSGYLLYISMYISLTSNMCHPSRKTDNVIKNVSADLHINVLQNSRFKDRPRVVPSSLSHRARP